MWRGLLNAIWLSAAYSASLLAAVCIGYWFAEVHYRRRKVEWKPSGIERALITMFGLILSFTLLPSNNSLKERTKLIHQSSDAVAELYRESQLLPPTAHDTVLTIQSIRDLDDPEQGFIRPNYVILLDLQRVIAKE